MNKIYGVIYKITNKVNGKIYIGQTISKLSHRFHQHTCNSKDTNKTSIRLYNAVRKYGKENFIIESLYEGFDKAALDACEISLIQMYSSNDERFGYNLQLGGGHTNAGRKWSEETKRKQSEVKIGIHAGEKHPFYGKNHTKESLIANSLKKDKSRGYYGFHIDENSSVFVRSGLFAKNLGFNKDKILETIKGSRYHKGYLWYRATESLDNVESDILNYKNKPKYTPTKEHMAKAHFAAKTPESIAKMKKTKQEMAKAGKIASPVWMHNKEIIAKSSASRMKTLTLMSPEKEIVVIGNVNEFAKKNNLQASNLRRVFSGERKNHKGWTALVEENL